MLLWFVVARRVVAVVVLSLSLMMVKLVGLVERFIAVGDDIRV